MARKQKPSHANAGDDPLAGAGEISRSELDEAREFLRERSWPVGVQPPSPGDWNPAGHNPPGWDGSRADPVADVLAVGLPSLLTAPLSPHAEFVARVQGIIDGGVSSRAKYWLQTAMKHEGDADYYDRLREKKLEAAGAATQGRAVTRAAGDTLSAKHARLQRDKAMTQAEAVMAADARMIGRGDQPR